MLSTCPSPSSAPAAIPVPETHSPLPISDKMQTTMMRLLTTIGAALPLAYAITPEQMIAAPRRSTALVNPSGEWALFTSSSYSWDTHSGTSTWNLLSISSGAITSLPAEWGDSVSEIVWIGPTNTSILYINGTNDDVPGGVTLWTADLATSPVTSTKVASLSAPFSGLKAARTTSGDIKFVVNSLAYKNGSAYNSELAIAARSTARLYDNIYVRHWDQYLTNERYAVFSGTLKGGKSLTESPKNLLLGITGPTRAESPVQPFGDSGDYDISSDGSKVIFLTKAPELPKANFTASYIYLVPHDGSSVAKAINGPGSSAPKAARGASGSPRFSPDGKKVTYNQQDGIYYESDRTKLYVADIIQWPAKITPVVGNWDSSPYALQWASDSKTIYAISDYIASSRLFKIPADAPASFVPKELTDNTTVSDYAPLPHGGFLISSNSLWSSRDFYTLSPNGTTKVLFSSTKADPELAGLGPNDLDTFWYEGTLGDKQQALIVKPTGFSKSKKYPLIFYVHGGPQGYTGNVWSTRWNLRVWADQGYVLVAPNPTGSTSYGQRLTDAIQGNWGGWPYEDLVLAWEYIAANLSYVDVDVAVEAGASYGGYMTNWIQGHDLGRKFKALVTHDGAGTTMSDYATEELWFMHHDMNGTIWANRENYEIWDPLKHAENFSTPHFIVHSDKDYRLTVGEGLTMFNVLQERGVPSRFLNFPDETHWVLNRENSLVWHTQIFNWINYWTGKIPSLDDSIVVTQ